ncbi:PREDICTED: putative uncharacterized protein DDB_G0286901 isoform X1 [Bactrocera latifrons]|uniref:MADF domain-containing protein n=1 Tax=Bactrocera latifrons TaxID=174628 RepID=A0A0K8U3F1_BACLA|nr:PREDICTED: putative uncharacterized protein DDB_G0286901 isoform X1 [Bactrocera latifrons]
MMDEQLIDEVAQHGVIFNRQKYYLNGSNGPSGAGGKYETKDEAWQTIAIKLRTDVETCKKRWKYLRERYVSQRKQGDPPVYEHLSRPYLEKMKFLDQHIQPRKSYRNVPNFLTSPHSVNSSNYSEFNMDSKSNGSMKNIGHFGNPAASQHHYHQSDPQHTMNVLNSSTVASSASENGNGHVKIEADQMFRDFAAAVASQQLQQISQTQLHHHQAAAVAAAMADSSQNYNEHFREGNHLNGNGVAHNGNSSGIGISSSSSSMKSPLSSPLDGVNGNHSGGNPSTNGAQQAASQPSSSNQISTHAYNDSNNDELDSSTGSSYHTKKPRVHLNSNVAGMTHNNNLSQQQHPSSHDTSNSTNAQYVEDTEDDSDDNSNSMLQPQAILNDNQINHYDSSASTSSAAAMQRNPNSSNNNQQQGMFPANADFLFQLYQQLPHQQQTVTSAQQQQHQHINKFQTPQNPVPARSSEHLLGELVTTELLKMTKERRKHVQKRILEILFFDD